MGKTCRGDTDLTWKTTHCKMLEKDKTYDLISDWCKRVNNGVSWIDYKQSGASIWVVETPDSSLDLNPTLTRFSTDTGRPLELHFLRAQPKPLSYYGNYWDLTKMFPDNTFACCPVSQPLCRLLPVGSLSSGISVSQRTASERCNDVLLTTADIPTDPMTESPVQLNLPPPLISQMFRLLFCHSKDIHLTATTSINGC